MSDFPSKAMISAVAERYSIGRLQATDPERRDQMLADLKMLLQLETKDQIGLAWNRVFAALLSAGHPLRRRTPTCTDDDPGTASVWYDYLPRETDQVDGFIACDVLLSVLKTDSPPEPIGEGRPNDAVLVVGRQLTWDVLRQDLPKTRDTDRILTHVQTNGEKRLQRFVEVAVCSLLEPPMRDLALVLNEVAGHQLVCLEELDPELSEINYWDKGSGLLIGLMVIATVLFPLEI